MTTIGTTAAELEQITGNQLHLLTDFPHLACIYENTKNTRTEAAVPVQSLSTHTSQYMQNLQSLYTVVTDSALTFWEENKQSRIYLILSFTARDIV